MANVTLVMKSGGIGKNFMLTALLPKFIKQHGNINIMTAYPDIFEGIEGIERVVYAGVPYGYDDYLNPKKGKTVFYLEPYDEFNYMAQECHLLDAMAHQLGIDYDPKTDMAQMPKINKIIKDQMDQIKLNFQKYILVQFSGSTYLNENGTASTRPGQTRSYPKELAEKFIELFNQKYPDIKVINIGLPGYEGLQGAINIGGLTEDKKVTQVIPYLGVPYLLKDALTFIGIDSYLQHMSTIKEVKKKGIVLWGATNPKCLGYSKNIALSGKCDDLHCNRPYTNINSDITATGTLWQCAEQSCIAVSPKKILEQVSNLIGESK